LDDSLKIEYRFWISCNDKPLFGKGKINLLLKIQETGSLRKAAEELKMSYRKVYYSIAQMNKIASEPIVTMKRGGKSGGNSEITNYGLKLISIYQNLDLEFSDFVTKKTI
jgi:molybdate transport system regulatory protein